MCSRMCNEPPYAISIHGEVIHVGKAQRNLGNRCVWPRAQRWDQRRPASVGPDEAAAAAVTAGRSQFRGPLPDLASRTGMVSFSSPGEHQLFACTVSRRTIIRDKSPSRRYLLLLRACPPRNNKTVGLNGSPAVTARAKQWIFSDRWVIICVFTFEHWHDQEKFQKLSWKCAFNF